MESLQFSRSGFRKSSGNPPLRSIDLSGLQLSNVPLDLFSSRLPKSLPDTFEQLSSPLSEEGHWSLQERAISKEGSYENTILRKRRKTRRERSQRKLENTKKLPPIDLKPQTNKFELISNDRSKPPIVKVASIPEKDNSKNISGNIEKSFLQEIRNKNLQSSLRKIGHGKHDYHFTTSVQAVTPLRSSKSIKKTNQNDTEKKSVWKSLTTELELKLKQRSEQRKSKDFDIEKKKAPTSISFSFKDSSWLRTVSTKTKDSFDLAHENSNPITVLQSNSCNFSGNQEIRTATIPAPPPQPNIKLFDRWTGKTSDDASSRNIYPLRLSPIDSLNKSSDVSVSPGSCSLPSYLNSTDDKESPIPYLEDKVIKDLQTESLYKSNSRTKRTLKEKRLRNKTTEFIPSDFNTSVRDTPFKKDFRYRSLPVSSYIESDLANRKSSRKVTTRLVYDFDSETDSEYENWTSSWTPPVKNDEIQVVRLSNNHLFEFPQSLLKLPFLLKIDLSWNQINRLPQNLSTLTNLTAVNLSHNELREVDVSQLKKLSSLELSFNRLTKFPKISNGKTLKLVNISYNQIWNISTPVDPTESSVEDEDMGRDHAGDHFSKSEDDPVSLNLRNNRITGAVTLASLQHVTELDVSDNGITSLEITSLAALRSLTCSNNAIVTVSLHGATLQSFTADNNRISSIRVQCHPRNLKNFSFSKNCIVSIPPWLVSCNQLRHLDVSHNRLTSLPSYVTSGHLNQLKYLAANHNQLESLSSSDGLSESSMSKNERQRRSNLEVLLLHHNFIETFSSYFFYNFLRLQVLNISSNKLQELPETSSTSQVEICPYLQELYAANNKIRDLTPLEICQSLRILHVPYNKITIFPESLTWSCELLEELILSGNFLTSIPSGITKLPRLKVLKVHLNPIKSLPKLCHLSSLKVIDASHCRLGRIEFESVVSPSLSTLDIASNPSMKIDKQQFSKCRSRRAVSMVNTATDKGRSFPLQDAPPKNCMESDSQSDEGNGSPSTPRQNQHKVKELPKLPWSVGFCEASGKDQGLTVGQLRVPDFEDGGNVGLLAMVDGGTSLETANRLLSLFSKTFKDEKLCCPDLADALKYALLSCLRKMILKDGMLPDAFCSAYFELDGKSPNEFDSRKSVRNLNSERISSSLRLCCFGDIKAIVISSDGPPLVVSAQSNNNIEEAKQKCKMNSNLKFGTASLPDPHMTLVRLGHHHRSLVIGSASLWEVMRPEEVNDVCQTLHDPAIVAKRLLTLAQSYGSKKALSVLVTYLPSGTLRNSYQYSSLGAKNINYNDKNCSNSSSSCNSTKTDKNTSSASAEAKFPFGIKSKRLYQREEEEKFRYPPCGQSDHEDTSAKRESPSVEVSMLDLYATVNKQKNGSKHNSSFPTKPTQYYHYPFSANSSKQEVNSSKLSICYPNKDTVSHASSIPDVLTHERIPPPVGFADSDDDSSGSDSGFSGHSESKITLPKASPGSSQVSEEQFKSWEYLLTKNSKVLFLRELDSLKSKKSSGSITSASVPNLSIMSDEEGTKGNSNGRDTSDSKLQSISSIVSSSSSHFQRNIVRKSRFARGAVKLLQNKFNLSHTLNINGNFQKIRSRSHESFRRFGSLQNLKQYQSNNNSKSILPNLNSVVAKSEDELNKVEMKEKFDTLELESRMQHYWRNGTGVTCF